MKDGFHISIDDCSIDYVVCDSVGEKNAYDYCFDSFKIFFSLSHGGIWNVEGVSYDFAPGSIILVSPLTCHHVELINGAEYECFTLLFSKSHLNSGVASLLDKMMTDVDIKCLFYSVEKIDFHIYELFRRFPLVNDLPETERKLYFEMLISELIILLSAIKIDSEETSNDCLGARVLRYLNNNIEKNISLEKLARRFFVSKYHLCRAFKEFSGISVHSYINYKRIMLAKQLISSGQMASVVAERVGFGDYSAFYRAYVRIVGKSPTTN